MPICKKCNARFPCQKKICGKYRNLANRSYCLDCSPFGGHNTKKLELPSKTPDQKRCPKCNKIKGKENFYVRTRGDLTGYCKKCSTLSGTESQSKRANERKSKLIK